MHLSQVWEMTRPQRECLCNIKRKHDACHLECTNSKPHGTVIGGVSENKCFERYCLRQKSQRPCAGKRGGEKTCGTFHDVSLKLPAFHCKTFEFHRFFNSTNVNHKRVLEQLQFQTRQWFQIVESKHCGPIEKQKHLKGSQHKTGQMELQGVSTRIV